MSSDWMKIVSKLSQLKVYDYFKNKRMPEFVEPLVTELVTSFATYPDATQQQLLSAITSETASVLGWYARKLAGRAVRESSPADLRNALMAVFISAQVDWRDSMSPLALIHNSAVRLHEDPRCLFDAVSETSSSAPISRDLLTNFLLRPSDLKSIQTFGFTEGEGPHGFDYIPLLVEDGGPTPLKS